MKIGYLIAAIAIGYAGASTTDLSAAAVRVPGASVDVGDGYYGPGYYNDGYYYNNGYYYGPGYYNRGYYYDDDYYGWRGRGYYPRRYYRYRRY